MTSSKFKGTDQQAFDYMNGLVNALILRGFKVVRKKIETVPWHKNCPSIFNDHELLPNQYFECHLGFKIDGLDEYSMNMLKGETKFFGLHLSKNTMKAGKNSILMATMRWYDRKIEDFQNELKRLKLYFESLGYVIEKEIVEFTLYDSKTNHDAMWILSK